MLIRVFDILVSGGLLVVSLPFLLFGIIGIKLTSKGPLFYPAARIGKDGHPFTMYKLRSMHVSSGGSAITGPNDARIFPFGNLLRKLKIDEIPQFWNVLNGDMAIVGPRPEDPGIVQNHYTDWMHETLKVRPGITSPGSIFGYHFGDAYLDPKDPQNSYINRQLPPKIAIERAYLDEMGFVNNLVVIFRTAFAILMTAIGHIPRHLPREAKAAEKWCGAAAFDPARSVLSS